MSVSIDLDAIRARQVDRWLLQATEGQHPNLTALQLSAADVPALLARITELEAENDDLAQRLEFKEQLSRQTQVALEKAQHDVRVLKSENDNFREMIRMMEGVDSEQYD